MSGWEVPSEQSWVAQRQYGALGKQAVSKGRVLGPHLSWAQTRASGLLKRFVGLKSSQGSESQQRAHSKLMKLILTGTIVCESSCLCSLNKLSVSSQALWMH